MEKEKVAILFTGGKDSCLALFKVRKKYDVKYLLSIIPESHDSYMFHKPSLNLLKKQAEMLGIDLIIKNSKGEKEIELRDLEKLISKVKDKVDYIIAGGVASRYQKERVEKICKKFNLRIILPLWQLNEEKLWGEALKNKFKIIFVKIACEGLDKSWLGKKINMKDLDRLIDLSKKYGFVLTGEGGDFETSVLFMPGFKKEIKLDYDIKSETAYRHFLKIKKFN